VIDVPAVAVGELAALAQRNMRLQCLIQDHQVQMLGENAAVIIDPTVRMAPPQPSG